MKSDLKKIICISLTLALLIPASSVFGTGFDQLRTRVLEIDPGLSLTSSRYMSSSDSSLLAENYYSYKPGGNIVPIVAFGNDIRGAAGYAMAVGIEEEKRGWRILGGSNGDYFSVANGIPLGPAIREGIVCTSGRNGFESIGFTRSGEAMIGDMNLDVSLENAFSGQVFSKLNFNKHIERHSGLVLYSSVYGKTNAAAASTCNVLLKVEDGEARIGQSIHTEIESVFEAEGATPLDEDHLLLSIHSDTPFTTALSIIRSMRPGEEVIISFNAAPGWQNMEYAIGGEKRLIKDGRTISDDTTIKAPRTAFGIKPDGEILLYTADGKNSAHSSGLTYTQLASRLLNLGCVDAINLDGGGSTQLHCTLPGDDFDTIINLPSETRRAGNYIMFAHRSSPPERASKLYLYPYDHIVLAGATLDFKVKAADSAFNAVSVPGSPAFRAEGGVGSFDGSLFTASMKNGRGRIIASAGGLTTSTNITVVETPDSISICDESGKPITGTLCVSPGAAVKLSAKALYKHFTIEAGEGSFTWSVSEDFGSIAEDGVFTAVDVMSESGTIRVSCGGASASIPVMVDMTPPDITAEISDGYLTAFIKDNVDLIVPRPNIKMSLDGETYEDFFYDHSTSTVMADFSSEEPGLHHVVIWASDLGGNERMKNLKFAVEPYEYGIIFSDMAKDYWALPYVEYLNSRGIIYGRAGEPPRFDPKASITRQEFTAIVIRWQGIDTSLYSDIMLPYNDVKSISNYALPAIRAATELGYISGKGTDGDLRFDPRGNITRQEAMTIIGRIIGPGYGKANLSLFSDSENISLFARPYVAVLVDQGIVSGSGGKILPKNTITRAEVAAIIFSCY